VSDDLPEGWAVAKLDDIVALALGGDWGKDPIEAIDGLVKVRVVRGTEFRSWRDQKGVSAAERLITASSLEKRRLKQGDIVIEVSGGGPNQPVGRTILIDADALKRADAPLVCSNFFRLLRLNPEVDPRFVNHFLDYAYAKGAFNEFQTETTNLRNLNVTDLLEKTEVLLAPLAEQRRIVAKVEQLLSKVEICRNRLAKIHILLKRFRHSVVAAATSGRLTADWREEHAAPVTGELNSLEEAKSQVHLPGAWSSLSVGDILEGLKYGTARKCGYEHRGVPVLRIPNIVSGKIDHTDLKFAELPAKEFNQLRLMPGDILLIRSNGSVSLVGRSAVVREKEKDLAYAGYLIRLRLNRAKVEPDFLHLCLASNDVRVQIELKARSTSGVNNINTEEVRALRFLLPPILEQREIVRRVEVLFAWADEIETRFAKVNAYTEKLTASLLAKAFRGELVPTEAELARRESRNYESARELLERLSANGTESVGPHRR
jgi:type I restriction enzyme S subunit